MAPVEGHVSFNGRPARATIVAQAINDQNQPRGRPSNADTQIDGSFALTYTERQAGALIGQYRVTISIFPLERAEGEFGFQQRFKPVKVVRFDREVKPGITNDWNFVLTY